MSPTPESVERSHSRITRWRVRDIVSSEVRLTIDQTLEALAAQGNSRHAELAVRFKSVALLQVPVVVTAQKESVGPTHESKPTAVPQHRWVIAPPNRDARMQQRAWNFWLEAIDSMEGEPRPSRRTMTVHVGAYLAAGEIPIATVEFSSFDCSMDEVSAMQRSDSDAVFSGQGLRSPWGESEIERLSLALELAPQLRLAHRAAAQWRDEFDVWRAFPPYDFCPPQPKATTTVPLTLDAWSQAIGEGIERIIVQDLLSGSTVRSIESAARPKDIREPSGKNRETNSMRKERILRCRLLPMLRGFNRPYELVQRAVQREHGKRPVAPPHGGAVRQFVTRFSRSFVQGWREGIAMFFAPLTGLRRSIHRALHQWRNRRR